MTREGAVRAVGSHRFRRTHRRRHGRQCIMRSHRIGPDRIVDHDHLGEGERLVIAIGVERRVGAVVMAMWVENRVEIVVGRSVGEAW